jgi:hypothetical protein
MQEESSPSIGNKAADEMPKRIPPNNPAIHEAIERVGHLS